MAEYGLLWKPGKIEGTVTLAGYEKTVGVLNAAYGISAYMSNASPKVGEKGITATFSSLTMTIHAGAYAAEMLDDLIRTRSLGDTTLYQLNQNVDGKKEASPTVTHEYTFTNTMITGWTTQFAGGGTSRNATLTIEFDHFTHKWGDKTSDYIVRNTVKSSK